jgi:TolB-like protein/thioredoxin-like negative regulator of GroEL
MLAILPFENMSGDPEQEYFSDGMTEEMIAQLVRLNPKQLGVIARTSAMTYKHTDKTADLIGRELGVDYLVEGSVRRAQNRVRITAQLIQTADQTHLWAESYDRDLADIFGIQADVARRIADSLAVELLPAQKAELGRAPTRSPKAHEAYLKGRYYWNKRNEEGMRKGIECFEEGLRIDPSYALAYVGLADCYTILAEQGLSPPKEVMPRAKGAVLKALELDDTLAEAHCSLAENLHFFDWKWKEAEAEFVRAIELSPGYATAHHWYANLLTTLGRMEEALEEMRRALESDPLSLMINAVLGVALYRSRKYDQATEQLLTTLELDPGFQPAHIFLADVYEQRSMFDEAIAECQKLLSLSGGTVRHRLALARCYASAGRSEDAQVILRDILTSAKGDYLPSQEVAAVYAALGEKERAFEWLERAYEERTTWMVYLGTSPQFDSLRSDPRFADLLRRVGLPEQSLGSVSKT